MKNNEKQRFQIIEFTVASSGEEVKTSSSNELDKIYKQVEGISLDLSTSEDALRSSKLGLKIGNLEISNDDFPASKFYGNFGVPQNERFFKPEYFVEANGNRAEMKYKDGGKAAAYPYTVVMTFWLKDLQN